MKSSAAIPAGKNPVGVAAVSRPAPPGMTALALPMPDDAPQPLASTPPRRDQSLQHLAFPWR